jgi:hypothetical protein
MTQTKSKTSADLRTELDAARADLSETAARIETLKDGELSEANVEALARANARCQILRGTIARLAAEIPNVERIEAQGEIERLEKVIERESAAAKKAADKLAGEVCKLLIPQCDSHRIWSFEFCKRRAHEIGMFAQDHTVSRVHADKARDATAERDRLREKLRA